MKNQYMVTIVAHPLTVNPKAKRFPFILQLSLLFRHFVKGAAMAIGLL
jgi:hypothetical protein